MVVRNISSVSWCSEALWEVFDSAPYTPKQLGVAHLALLLVFLGTKLSRFDEVRERVFYFPRVFHAFAGENVYCSTVGGDFGLR